MTRRARGLERIGSPRLPIRLPARARDRGSAIAEFVMVGSLVILLGMSIIQLGLVLYTRNLVISAAAEGARAGARADASPADAVARTRSILTDSLSAAYAQDVTAAKVRQPDGVVVVQVTVEAPVPVIALIGPAGTMTLTGRAFDERQVLSP